MRSPVQFRLTFLTRRACLAATIVQAFCLVPAGAQAGSSTAWESLKAPGAVVLFRHASAPGGGDPAGFVLGDCRTQRNLSAEGQEQARRIGATLRQRGVNVSAVWHSAWCRTQETAQLAFPAMSPPSLRAEPAFNSFFGNTDSGPAHTAAARQLLLGWRGPGALVVVTHQVNITALTGVVPQSGEGVVLQPEGEQLLVKGSVLP